MFYQLYRYMKKIYFVLVAAIAVAAVCAFTSCSNTEKKKLGEYELTENNGKYGLKSEGGSVVLAPEFDEIVEDTVNKAVFAKTGELTSIVVQSSVIASGIKIEAVEPVEGNPDYAYIKADGKKMLWKIGTSSTFGPFEDIKLLDGIIFMSQDGKWGAATINLQALAPRSYSKVYVVKNGDDLAVLVKAKHGWEMYTGDGGVSDGSRYDIPTKKLEPKIKALKLEGEIGVAKVDWKL